MHSKLLVRSSGRLCARAENVWFQKFDLSAKVQGQCNLTLERGFSTLEQTMLYQFVNLIIQITFSVLSLSKTLQNSRSRASLPRIHLLSLISPNPLGFRPKFFTKVGYHLEGFVVCGEDRVSTPLILGVSSHFFFKTGCRDFLRVIYIFLQDLDDFRNHPSIALKIEF